MSLESAVTTSPPLPMLAEFAIRLASGLAALLLLTPSALVPPKFFRTHCQVILGLLVLAALAESRTGSGGVALGLTVGAGCLAYLASIAWGLGLPRLGVPLAALIALATSAVLAWPLGLLAEPRWFWIVAGRLSSAFVLGSTLTAMLLGHYYLTAPAMSIEPLKRFVRCMVWGLSVRVALSAMGMAIWLNGEGSTGVEPLFLAMRWGMGLAGPILATMLAWKTVSIRSTQSATGILYIAMTLLLFGEVSALVLARQVSWLI